VVGLFSCTKSLHLHICTSASASKSTADRDTKIFGKKIVLEFFLLIRLKSLVSASASAFSN
jgi:hypothetical protein